MRRIAALVISFLLMIPHWAAAQWAEIDVRVVTRKPDQAYSYYRSPDQLSEMRAEMTHGEYRSLPNRPGEPPRDPSVPADWIWVGALIAADFETPTGNLQVGDIADDGTLIWVRTPEELITLERKDFTVSEEAGKVTITPDPDLFTIRQGKLAPRTRDARKDTP